MMTDINLQHMLCYRRPHGSETERVFIDRFIAPVARPDVFGNYIVRIGNSGLPGGGPGKGRTSPVLWSCHTDTVHHHDGYQDVVQEGAVYKLKPNSKSGCLGADCTTGIWVMLNMIRACVPGLYVFHRAEERGGLGSHYIAEETPELLEGVSIAIALDRRAQHSVITHQIGGRCASDAFAASLQAQIPYLSADSGGVFTDTAQYTHLVPECTNLSVGYDNEHTPSETQDVAFAYRLLKSLMRLDVSALVVARDPAVTEYDDGDWYDDYYGSGGAWSDYRDPIGVAEQYDCFEYYNRFIKKHYHQ